MHEIELTLAALGDEPPLSGDGRRGPPDRREISARWLSGTVLTGLTSSILMGVALFAALDGREQLATPPEIAMLAHAAHEGTSGEAARQRRISPPRAVTKASDKRRMEVATVTRVGDREVVRSIPFVEVKMALAAGHSTNRPYPPFDPLAIFAANENAAKSGVRRLIYGAKVESEVTLKTIDFPLSTANYDQSSNLSTAEVEEVVREAAAALGDGEVQAAALHYVNPKRFGHGGGAGLTAPLGVHIVPENMSVSPMAQDADSATGFAEEIIPVSSEQDVGDVLDDAGYEGPDAKGMAEAVAKLLNGPKLKAGTVLRVGVETEGDQSRIVRASVYYHAEHVLTIAVDDDGQYVPADAPPPDPEIATAFDDKPTVRARSDLPTIYDAIYRTAYSYGMSKELTQQLIKILAPDVDFQSRVAPSDTLNVLYSEPGGDDGVPDKPELLYVNATFGGQTRAYYRFQLKNGAVDYFDPKGRSSKQFLYRDPVPGARISRGFGMERHPILGIMRMHTGVDYAIAQGTPILAAGNGVIEKAGWGSGYGRETIIRHANGYETLYAHQSAFARGIEPGVRVRQGQVIGYVGSTGMSTGPHVHFEIRINNRPVDPLRVRLPVGRTLKGPDLVAFERERDRIDNLLKREDSGTMKVASGGS